MVRRDGFAPIGAYGVIGDGRSVALVAADGAIDWWAVPAMDAPPVFAAVLDPETGGSFTVEPAVPYQVQRRYLPGTNVLETTFTTGTGVVRMMDAVNRDVDGLLGWTELAREVRCGHGEVPIRSLIAARTRIWSRGLHAYPASPPYQRRTGQQARDARLRPDRPLPGRRPSARRMGGARITRTVIPGSRSCITFRYTAMSGRMLAALGFLLAG